LYSSFNANFKADYLGGSKKTKFAGNFAIRSIEMYRKHMRKALTQSQRFTSPVPINQMAELAKPIVSLGNMTGEGWFLTAEMIELLEHGVDNVICTQPFACLPNHVTGKGMIKELKRHYPAANIVPIDYDPGASEVNQLNRIKLMLATANKRY